jgi:hypothetical protein
VDGFRVDATKHISPVDLSAIFKEINPETFVLCEIITDDWSKMNSYLVERPDFRFYNFPLLAKICGLFRAEGDFRNGEFLNVGKENLKNSVSFIRNHDLDRGAASRGSEGMSGDFWNIRNEDIHLAHAFIFGREVGVPYVFADMVNPEPEVDVTPHERYDDPSIISGIQFYKTTENLSEQLIYAEKDLILWQRGNGHFVVVNKGAREIRLKLLQTNLTQGKYREAIHGNRVTVNEDQRIELFSIEAKSCQYYQLVD